MDGAGCFVNWIGCCEVTRTCTGSDSEWLDFGIRVVLRRAPRRGLVESIRNDERRNVLRCPGFDRYLCLPGFAIEPPCLGQRAEILQGEEVQMAQEQSRFHQRRLILVDCVCRDVEFGNINSLALTVAEEFECKVK